MSQAKTQGRRPAPDELRFPVILRRLSGRSLAIVARHSDVLKLPKGSRIVRKDNKRPHLFFVLDGNLLVQIDDRQEQSVAGGTTRARFPLIPDDASHAVCTCTNDSTLLRVPSGILRQILDQDPAVAESAEPLRVEEDRLEDRIYMDFSEAVKNGTLKLPGMPDVAVQIARHIDSTESTSASIARIVQMDPSLTARLVQVANSPAFGGRVPIDSCEDAVTRLGHDATRELVTGFVLKGVFRTRHQGLKQRMHDVWVHSTRVAAICHALARRTPALEPAHALLVGLVHDIGIIPILTQAHHYPGLAENSRLLDHVCTRLRADFGAMTLRQWGFAAEFVDAALNAENWYRNKRPEVDYVDILVIAQLHEFVGTPRMAELPRLDEVPAFHKLALGKLSPRMSLQVLDEAKSEIDQVRQLIA